MLGFLGGETTMEAPTSPKPRKGGPQPEGKVNDAIIKAGRLFGSILYRNRRGMLPLPRGGMLPFGLGPAGFTDEIGYTPIKITEEMVGRTVAVFPAIEAKTDTVTVASHQQSVIDELKAHGCIAGVATCGEDVRSIIQSWERNRG
jgi:hypothetical protein